MTSTLFSFLFPHPDLAERYSRSFHAEPQKVIYEFRGWKDSARVLYIQKGIFQIEVLQHSRWHPIDLVLQDQFLGIESFLENREEWKGIHYRVKSLTEGEGCLIKKHYFLDHMYANPKVFFALVEQLTRGLLHHQYIAYRQVGELTKDVVHYLNQLVESGGFYPQNGQVVLPKEINTKVIAEHLHTSEKQLHEAIKVLEAEHILKQKYRSFILQADS
ncbi:Crp/Fnr family transcriptional regulator [Listeria aquatica]|uniref:Crp/Fnr family transcriptional regulator n=1 Tax=Listeria aquatica TaxID=1494960 RepID=A0A841ZQ34_9LIST|nr:Crp/Fnr family transcriptional regulator [Listeria aquatica]MBC1522293.1 Crp/Fnr family transcriptional regulator [Listeria aquatica]